MELASTRCEPTPYGWASVSAAGWPSSVDPSRAPPAAVPAAKVAIVAAPPTPSPDPAESEDASPPPASASATSAEPCGCDGGPVGFHVLRRARMIRAPRLERGRIRPGRMRRRQHEPRSLSRRRRIKPNLRPRRPVTPTVRPVIQPRPVTPNVPLDRITPRHLTLIIQQPMGTRPIRMQLARCIHGRTPARRLPGWLPRPPPSTDDPNPPARTRKNPTPAGCVGANNEPRSLSRRRRIKPNLRPRRPVTPTVRPVIQPRPVTPNVPLDRITPRHLTLIIQQPMGTRPIRMQLITGNGFFAHSRTAIYSTRPALRAGAPDTLSPTAPGLVIRSLNSEASHAPSDAPAPVRQQWRHSFFI